MSAAQLKVQQRRGLAGVKRNQRETIRTLGLKRIGDVVIKEDRPEIRGMVNTVRHLVTVEEIGTVGSPRPAPDELAPGRPAPAGGDEMSGLTQRLASSSEGVHVFDHGEFVEWHKSEAGRSLIWSSELGLADLLDVVQTTIGSADGEHRGLVDFDDNPGEPTTAGAARELAVGDPGRVTFLRLEFAGGIALVWTPTSGSQEIEQMSRFAETSVFFTATTVEAAALTMRRTATKRLVSLAARIVQSVAA